MIIVRFKLLISLVFIIFLCSCSAPPKDTLSISLLEAVNTSFRNDTTSVSIIDLFRRFRVNHNVEHLITVLRKGEEIILEGERGEPGENTLIYTIGKNRLKVHKTVFVTSDRKKRIFYSLDGDKWYGTKNRRKEGIYNLDYKFLTDTRYDRNGGSLFIAFQWIVDKSDIADPVRMKKKEVLSLEKDMIFYSEGRMEDTVDLADCFLRLSEGTELSYEIGFSGNLLNSRTSDSGIDVEIREDFHIYTTNDSSYKMGISRDGLRWNYNIFAFEFNVQEYFQADSPVSFDYMRNMEIIYDE